MSDATDELLGVFQDWVEQVMHRSMRNVFRFARQNNLSIPQLGALLRLYERGTCDVSGMGDELGVTSAAASQMLDRLVQQGLIERSENPQDRRVRQIVLTDKGLQVVQASVRARHEWLGEMAGALSLDEQKQVVDVLRLLIERARRLEV